MQIQSTNLFFRLTYRFLDYTPFISPVKNLTDIFIKTIVRPEINSHASSYTQHLMSKTKTECTGLAVALGTVSALICFLAFKVLMKDSKVPDIEKREASLTERESNLSKREATLAAKQKDKQVDELGTVQNSDSRLKEDPETCLLKQKAERGDVEAMVQLGNRYSDIKKGSDFVQAARWFQKAASKNSVEGQIQLATLQFKGYGLPQDTKSAIENLSQLATAKNIRATRVLGRLLSYPDNLKWLKLGADLTDVECIYEYSLALKNQIPVPTGEIIKNLRTAHQLKHPLAATRLRELAESIEKGPFKNGESFFYLAVIYNALADEAKAESALQKSAEASYPYALTEYGKLCLKKNRLMEAFQWFREALRLNLTQEEATKGLNLILQRFKNLPREQEPDARTCYVLGLVAMELKDLEEGKRYFAKAASKDDYYGLLAYAYTYRGVDQVKQCEELLNRAKKLPEVIGKADKEKEIERILEAIQSWPNNPHPNQSSPYSILHEYREVAYVL